MRDEHPDILELELARKGEAAAETMAHLASCEECKRKIEELESVAHALRPDKNNAKISEKADSEIFVFISDKAKEIKSPKTIKFPRYIFRIAASAALVFLCLFIFFKHKKEVKPANKSMLAEKALSNDLNKDGKVDIVDAYLFALKNDKNQAIKTARLSVRLKDN